MSGVSLDRIACSSPPASERLQDTDFAEVSQRVRQPFCNRLVGCTAHPRSAVGQNENPASLALCQLRLAADITARRVRLASRSQPVDVPNGSNRPDLPNTEPSTGLVV